MPNLNLRIVSDNPADRSTLTASATSGAFAVSNLQTGDKSNLFRAPGTSVTLTGTCPTTEVAACVALPYCNLSPTATMRVRLYSDSAGTTLVLDTGAVLACPAPAIKLRGWTAAQSASAYAYGGGAIARLWFAQTSWQRYVIDLVDVNNVQGYIEAAARLVVAPYWSPTYNGSSPSLTFVDRSIHYRTEAGVLKTDAGTISKKVLIDLGLMPPADRSTCVDLLRGSRAQPIFVSMNPGSSDLALERDMTVYGKRTEDSEVALQYALKYGTKIPVEEV